MRGGSRSRKRGKKGLIVFYSQLGGEKNRYRVLSSTDEKGKHKKQEKQKKKEKKDLCFPSKRQGEGRELKDIQHDMQ